MRIVFLFFVVLFSAFAASAETVGEWCDTMIPENKKFDAKLIITKKADSSFQSLRRFQDGSELKQSLLKQTPKKFVVADNQFGDGMRIRSDGFVDAFDNDGTIRTIPPFTKNCGYQK